MRLLYAAQPKYETTDRILQNQQFQSALNHQISTAVSQALNSHFTQQQHNNPTNLVSQQRSVNSTFSDVNFQHGTGAANQFSESNRHQQQPLQFRHPDLPPVALKTVEKIKNGEFVDFSTLLPVTPNKVTLSDLEPQYQFKLSDPN